MGFSFESKISQSSSYIWLCDFSDLMKNLWNHTCIGWILGQGSTDQPSGPDESKNSKYHAFN